MIVRPTFDFREWERELARVPPPRFTSPSKSTVVIVAVALRRHARSDGTNAHPGTARLVEETGLSRPSVLRALDWLVENRWIRRHPRAGRQADVFDLLPAEIPLANGPVDLADVPEEAPEDDAVRTLSDLWDEAPDPDRLRSNVRSNLAVNSSGQIDRKPAVAVKPFDHKKKQLEITTSSRELVTSADAGARVPAREGPDPVAPEGLVWSGEIDRFGTRRYADRYGNRLATDADVEAHYAPKPSIPAPMAAAADRVRDVRSRLGWQPGPGVTDPPPARSDVWKDPTFDPFTASPHPDNVEWLDDYRETDIAPGARPNSNGRKEEPTKESPDAVGKRKSGTVAPTTPGANTNVDDPF